MAEPRMRSIGRSWVGSAFVLIVLELILVYQAVQADISGPQKVFGVFAGLAILCFASLLYMVKLVFYD